VSLCSPVYPHGPPGLRKHKVLQAIARVGHGALREPSFLFMCKIRMFALGPVAVDCLFESTSPERVGTPPSPLETACCSPPVQLLLSVLGSAMVGAKTCGFPLFCALRVSSLRQPANKGVYQKQHKS
jgi:hypothetical protein